MRKHNKRGILIILVFIMIVGVFPSSIAANELSDAKKEKEALEQKKKDIDNKIASLESEKTDIVNYIEKLDLQLNELTKQINTLIVEIEEAEVDLKVTQEELEKAKAHEEKQYESMKKRIQYIYENGEPSYLEILIESKDISEFLNQVEIRSKITEYDNNLLDEYNKITQKVIEKEEELEEKLASLKLMQEELEYEQEAVETLVQAKGEELARHEEQLIASENVAREYEAELEAKLAEIQHLEEEERRRQEEELRRKQEEERKRKEAAERKRLEEARRAAEAEAGNNNSSESSNANSGSHTGTGVFTWPTPSSRRITSYYGWRIHPIFGNNRLHTGIDVGAPYGTNIVAADSGRVVEAGYNGGYGNCVKIDHGNGIETLYAHCSQLVVNVGDTVNRGQIIAYVGSTGNSTGPHLHFEVRVNGGHTNPLGYVN